MINFNINPKDFDQQVFQTNTEFTQEQYNTWLHDTATKALQRIYEKIDNCADIEPSDQYILGDVINLLSTITITTEPRGETWTVTPDDIADKYDISHLSCEEVRTLVDRCANCCQNDGMADYYWEAIRYICEEEYHLTEKEDVEEEEEEEPTQAYCQFMDTATGHTYTREFVLSEDCEDYTDDGRSIWSDCFTADGNDYEIMFTEGDDAPSAYKVHHYDGCSENHDEDIDIIQSYIY